MQTEQSSSSPQVAIKNCNSCAHNHNNNCLVSGWSIMNTRQNCQDLCDANFSRWEPKPVKEKKAHIRWGDRAKEWITIFDRSNKS